VVDRPNGRDDNVGYGAREGRQARVRRRDELAAGVGAAHLDWTFVTTDLPDAVTAARDRAEAPSSDSGKDLDVVLMGGGATVCSALGARRRAGRCADAALAYAIRASGGGSLTSA
jgi:hypothetical protein